MKETEHLGDPRFDGRIILKWVFCLGVLSVLMKESEGKKTVEKPKV